MDGGHTSERGAGGGRTTWMTGGQDNAASRYRQWMGMKQHAWGPSRQQNRLQHKRNTRHDGCWVFGKLGGYRASHHQPAWYEHTGTSASLGFTSAYSTRHSFLPASGQTPPTRYTRSVHRQRKARCGRGTQSQRCALRPTQAVCSSLNGCLWFPRQPARPLAGRQVLPWTTIMQELPERKSKPLVLLLIRRPHAPPPPIHMTTLSGLIQIYPYI